MESFRFSLCVNDQFSANAQVSSSTCKNCVLKTREVDKSGRCKTKLITERIDKMAPWVLYIYVVSSILMCDGRTRSLLILFTHSYLLSIKTMTILFYQVIPRFSYIKSKVVIIARVHISYAALLYFERIVIRS